MGNLIRKQIYIEEEQIYALELEVSRVKDLDVSKLVRIAIDEHLHRKEKSKDWKNDPLTKAIGKIKLSVSDASDKHDSYLYG